MFKILVVADSAWSKQRSITWNELRATDEQVLARLWEGEKNKNNLYRKNLAADNLVEEKLRLFKGNLPKLY